MDLEELRNQLGEIDRKIIELVAARQTLSSDIGRVKRANALPTRNYNQEREVLQRARAAAAQLGMSPEIAEQLMLLLIRSSLIVQERDQVAAYGKGSDRRVLVIGGNGKMGQWMVRFLDSQGFAVEVADPAGPVPGHPHWADWRDSDLQQDFIIVATPLQPSRDILHQLAGRRPRGVVFDIGSIKSPLRSGLMALVQAGVKVTSLHPMFGPNTELLTGQHVIFVDLGVAEATEQARSLFASTMALQVDMDLESHDRVIAYVLGLSHALNIAFFTALADSGESAPKLAEVSSTTFDAQLDVARRVAEDNPHLYFEIQRLNDYGTESLSALLYAVERLRSVVRASDQAGFVSLMERGRAYLGGRSSNKERAP